MKEGLHDSVVVVAADEVGVAVAANSQAANDDPQLPDDDGEFDEGATAPEYGSEKTLQLRLQKGEKTRRLRRMRTKRKWKRRRLTTRTTTTLKMMTLKMKTKRMKKGEEEELRTSQDVEVGVATDAALAAAHGD